MRAYSNMPLEDFADQLHDIVAAQPFSPLRALIIDQIDSITAGPTENEIAERISEAEDKAEKAATKIGREEMYEEMLDHFEKHGLEQILELLGQVKP